MAAPQMAQFIDTPRPMRRRREKPIPITPFNVVVIAQAGRLEFEAALFAAAFRHFNPDFPGKLIVASPQPGPLWPNDPSPKAPGLSDLLDRLGAEQITFPSEHFGASYPYGNKIEVLRALPEGAPFVFFDSDTLVLGDLTEVPFDFDRPSASLRVTGTWPKVPLYGPGYGAIWGALYDRFGLDFASSLDPSQPGEFWRHYLYFNAGFFYHRSAHDFGTRFLEIALSIRDDPPEALACQSLDPWLDQIALPLVIHAFGGGRDALAPGWLDGSHSCHYRHLPLLYAREPQRIVDVLEEVTRPNWIKKVLKQHEPMRRMIYQGKGAKARALFDRANLPRREQAIRNTLKREKLWLR